MTSFFDIFLKEFPFFKALPCKAIEEISYLAHRCKNWLVARKNFGFATSYQTAGERALELLKDSGAKPSYLGYGRTTVWHTVF